MKKIKEVIVYCAGDSSNISTWSNVPYFFTKELENRGIKVDRVDIKIDRSNKITNYFIYHVITFIRRSLIVMRFGKKTKYKFEYSRFYENEVKKIMRQAVQDYANADLQIGFSLTYQNSCNIPYVMLGDWIIDYRIHNKQKRNPFFEEKIIINKQISELKRAAMIVSILPCSTKFISNSIDNETKVFYLGMGVNSLIPFKFNPNRYKSNRIVFIGRKDGYMDGLLKIINIVNLLNRIATKKYIIDVIGIKSNDVHDVDISSCNFHGYLYKNNEEQARLYYDIIKNAKLTINISDNWMAMSSIVEMMYLGIPAIVSTNIEVEELFSNNECVISISDSNDIESVEKAVLHYMEMGKDEYRKISYKAHDSMKENEWHKIVNKFITEVEKSL